MRPPRPYAKLVFAWLALMALLALTCASAFTSLGGWNTVGNFAIAAMKAILVAVVFMHLFAGRPVHRAVVASAFFVLSLLLGIGAADDAARPTAAVPWQVPQGAISVVR